MTEYTDYINIDNITGLKYLNWEDYLDHIELFSDGKCEDKYIIECLINSDIVSDIRDIKQRLFSIYVAIDYIFSDNNFNDREYIIWREKISSLYFDLENDYKDSKNNNGSWKYIDITFDNLYDDICKENNFAKTIPLSELFSDGYYLKLMLRNMEEKDNG